MTTTQPVTTTPLTQDEQIDQLGRYKYGWADVDTAGASARRSLWLQYSDFRGDVPAAWQGRRIVLHIAGCEGACYVYVNGQPVGLQKDSRTPAETRIDRWLCAVRLVKTRPLATRLCEAGHVRVNGPRFRPNPPA